MDSELKSNTVAGVRESETARALSKLHAVIEINHKVFSELDGRLTPVLRGDQPVPAKEEIKPGFQTALASEINVAVEKLESLYKYIQSVKSRIEL